MPYFTFTMPWHFVRFECNRLSATYFRAVVKEKIMKISNDIYQIEHS